MLQISDAPVKGSNTDVSLRTGLLSRVSPPSGWLDEVPKRESWGIFGAARYRPDVLANSLKAVESTEWSWEH